MCGLMSDLVICKFRKSMVIHDIECPYWDQVSLNNTKPNHPFTSELQTYESKWYIKMVHIYIHVNQLWLERWSFSQVTVELISRVMVWNMIGNVNDWLVSFTPEHHRCKASHCSHCSIWLHMGSFDIFQIQRVKKCKCMNENLVRQDVMAVETLTLKTCVPNFFTIKVQFVYGGKKCMMSFLASPLCLSLNCYTMCFGMNIKFM